MLVRSFSSVYVWTHPTHQVPGTLELYEIRARINQTLAENGVIQQLSAHGVPLGALAGKDEPSSSIKTRPYGLRVFLQCLCKGAYGTRDDGRPPGKRSTLTSQRVTQVIKIRILVYYLQ